MLGGVTTTHGAGASGADGAIVPAADLFERHRSYLWNLSYRLLGVAADADDAVQETFTRLLERPPARADAPLLPWLVRVAANVARDELRRRQRRGYKGPWLPSPVPDERLAVAGFDAPDARYALRESAALGFLVALEALTPTQRAVLVLRDVFDHSVRETAAALDLSEANVKTTLHRARQAMAGYEARRRPLGPGLAEETERVLARFLAALAQGDVAAVLDLLADDVTSLADGGGEFAAALRPVVGREAVAALYVGLARKGADPDARVTLRRVNGLPALVLEQTPRSPRFAPRVVLQPDLDEAGRIRRLHSMMLPRKLTALWPDGA